MEINKCIKIIIILTLFLFLSIEVTNTAFGYGGGSSGGSGGSGDKNENESSKPNIQIEKLSDKEVKKIFALIGGKSGNNLSNIFSGTDLTKRELMAIRQSILEGDSTAANTEATIISGLTFTVECLDKAGQISQIGLSFVPGVGWVTAGLLDTARGGADAYRDGKSASEILSEAAIAGVSSVTINKLSPLGADKTFNNAKSAWNIATKGSGKNTVKAIKIFSTNIVKYGLKKEGESRAGNALKDTLNNAVKQSKNKVSRPTYRTTWMGPGGFTVTKTGRKLYH